MKSIAVGEVSLLALQNILQHAIAPRPICFASTVDNHGNINLSPFSFFNLVSTNPPICVFSPSRRVRDNTTKHTLENILEVPECVINVVDYQMVQQTSLASTEYAKGVNEFEKAGFTMLPSTLVKPPRVAESPVQLECVVNQVISLGDGPGAGNLVLAEVKAIHIKEEVLGADGLPDQHKLNLVARLGGNWYCKTSAENLFEVPKPLRTLGIGVDALPATVRASKVLSGNDLGLLGNVESLPTLAEIENIGLNPLVKNVLDATMDNVAQRQQELHTLAKQFIAQGHVYDAFKMLML